MKYFINQNSDVHAFEDDGSQDELISQTMREMTAEEITSHLEPTPLSTEDVEKLRLIAYADPVSGSDRYFAEAQRLLATKAPQDEIDQAVAAGVQVYEEIQRVYPWPK